VRAFRQAHADVKQINLCQLVVAASSVVIGVVAEHWFPHQRAWAALYAIAVAVIDAAFLEPAAKTKQQVGALIQEQFDEHVLQLPWTKTARPEPEQVHALAEAHARKHSEDKSIQDWYPKAVDALPIEQARLICQRSNFSWDGAQRRAFCTLYLVGLIVLAIAVLGWGVFKEMNVEQFVPLLASLLPAALHVLRTRNAHLGAARESEASKSYLQQLWSRLGLLGSEELNRESSILEEEIYQRRRTAPPVPEWFYKRRRKQAGEEMEAAADRMVAELQDRARPSPASLPRVSVPALLSAGASVEGAAELFPDASHLHDDREKRRT
jgi:hypothetical protein